MSTPLVKKICRNVKAAADLTRGGARLGLDSGIQSGQAGGQKGRAHIGGKPSVYNLRTVKRAAARGTGGARSAGGSRKRGAKNAPHAAGGESPPDRHRAPRQPPAGAAGRGGAGGEATPRQTRQKKAAAAAGKAKAGSTEKAPGGRATRAQLRSPQRSARRGTNPGGGTDPGKGDRAATKAAPRDAQNRGTTTPGAEATHHRTSAPGGSRPGGLSRGGGRSPRAASGRPAISNRGWALSQPPPPRGSNRGDRPPPPAKSPAPHNPPRGASRAA